MAVTAAEVKSEVLNFRQENVVQPIAHVVFRLPRHFEMENEMHVMKYSSLFAIANQCVANESSAIDTQKTVDNFKSACRSWMTFLGKDENKNNVGGELNTQFDEKLSKYLAELKAARLADSTIRDRKSAIKKLYTIYQTQSSVLKNDRSSDIGVELRRLLQRADLSYKQLAKESGVSPSFIQRLLNGSNPQKDRDSKVRRLESALIRRGVITSPGHLTELLKFVSNTTNRASPQFAKNVLGLNSNSLEDAKVCFKNLTDKPLRRITLTQFKTDFPSLYTFLNLYRAHKVSSGQWTVHPVQTKKRGLWVFNHNGTASYSPSFDNYLSTLFGYIAYLRDYSMVPKNKIDSVDNLIDGLLLVQYIQFLKERRKGVLGGNAQRLGALCTELSREVLRQVNAGLLREPSRFDEIGSLKKRIEVLTKKTAIHRIRNPWDKLNPFFELEEPAKPFIEISKMLLAEAKAPQSFIADAIALRDAFLLRLLAALPLRERTIVSLTYRADNTGHLRYSNKEEAWLLDLPANIIKNQRPIRRVLPTSFNSLIEAYLSEARPRLLETYGGALEVDWLIVAKNTAKSRHNEMLVDEDGATYTVAPGQFLISPRLAVITQKYLGIAIRAHAFRHLMATRFLKLNPGQFQACADLLGDKIETVTAHYAFHDAKWNERLLNESFEKAFA